MLWPSSSGEMSEADVKKVGRQGEEAGRKTVLPRGGRVHAAPGGGGFRRACKQQARCQAIIVKTGGLRGN